MSNVSAEDLVAEALELCRKPDFSAAKRFQEQVSPLAEIRDRHPEIRTAAGVDLAYRGDVCLCALAVVGIPEMKVSETVFAEASVVFPYVPGYLFFREFPAFFAAWNLLASKPDLLMFDGHGLAHPRRAGIALMAGVLLDFPTIGVGKSRLTGVYEEPGSTRFSATPLADSAGDQIGWALRTKAEPRPAKPVFISPGHRVSLDGSLELAKAFTGKWRVPVPTREAHVAGKAAFF
jgi:deoxyribonuclease V